MQNLNNGKVNFVILVYFASMTGNIWLFQDTDKIIHYLGSVCTVVALPHSGTEPQSLGIYLTLVMLQNVYIQLWPHHSV
jgi:hypothetical protein